MWCLSYLTEPTDQRALLKWLKKGTKPMVLFVEPVRSHGRKKEKCDGGKMVVWPKTYYDKMFKGLGLTIIKEGEFNSKEAAG